ncbi:MAG: Asp/Glu racemase [Alphaproteobacteria bacterium]|nr:Asp/Glu racemase [Alphaproteobacteria bacterium]
MAVIDTDDLVLSKRKLPHALDKGIGTRAVVGLLVLASDYTIEYEFRRVFSMAGVALYHARLWNDTNITVETLAAMETEIPKAARLLPPQADFDVIGYGCTSGTAVMGEDKVFARIREGKAARHCTTPVTGALAALKALSVRRIALLTPYADEVNQSLRRFFMGRGLEIPVMGSFTELDDNKVARISTASIRDAAIDLGKHPAVDGVFVSCTSLRTIDIAAEVESVIGKPVTASNHAMAWHSLRLAGVQDKLPQFGRLFAL